MHMKQKTFNQAAALIFAIVAVFHLARVVLGWSAVIGTWAVPTWLSIVGLVVAGYLAYNAYNLSK